jgi:hypothetical protein
MSTIPSSVHLALHDPVFRRTDGASVSAALASLGTPVPETFREFYETYEGPFGSRRTGFELADLCESPPTIVTLTKACRDTFGWPAHFLVLTDLLGNAVLVLDAERDLVFNVDFEGGEEELLAGTLAPRWPSFAAFLEEYFQQN